MINAVMLGADRGFRPAADPRRRRSRPRSAPTARRSRRTSRASAPVSTPRGSRRRRIDASATDAASASRRRPSPSFERAIARHAGPRARDIVAEGVRRLAAYQDAAYARLYLDRLAAIRSADERAACRRPAAAGDRAASGGAHVLRGRDPRRRGEDRSGALRAHRGRDRRQAGRAVHRHRIPQARHRGNVLDPAALAGDARSSRSPSGAAGSTGCIGAWRSTPPRSRATCASGCWRSCAAGGRSPIASPRSSARSRPGSALILEAAQLSGDLALEVAECARLIKGYGDTYKRGAANYQLIETRVIRPVLAGQIALRLGADAIASARVAALADPDGEALTRCLDRLGQQNALGIAAE